MRINSVTSGSPGADLVGLMQTYVGLQDQMSVNATNAANAANAATGNDALRAPAAAILKPAYRAFWAKPSAARASNGSGGSRIAVARADHGNEAEQPLWSRMQSEQRLRGPIPGNNPLEVPMRAERVHVSRIGQDHDRTAAKTRTADSAARTPGTGALASLRQQVLARRRAEHWMMTWTVAAPGFAAA